MPSPFPGMNPYLEVESLWPSFQQQLINCLYQMLLPNLVDRYRSRVVVRDYVTEEPLFTSILKIDHREHLMEVRNRADDRLITLIEMVSPSNRCTAEGRQKILDNRTAAIAQKANVVWIDVVLQGQPPITMQHPGVPDWDYSIMVCRTAQPDRPEVYTGTLPKRLPRFKIPLAADDRDTIIDLQTCFTRCYELGNFSSKISYDKDPPVPLQDENKQWLESFLKSEKLRV